jgi:hypothetical protein
MAILGKILKELRYERERIQQELERVEGVITAMANLSPDGRSGMKLSRTRKPRRKLSAAARARIAAAQRARWAKFKKQHKPA